MYYFSSMRVADATICWPMNISNYVLFIKKKILFLLTLLFNLFKSMEQTKQKKKANKCEINELSMLL